MGNSCKYFLKKCGKTQFDNLKKEFGYDKAREALYQSKDRNFINKYRDTLELDEYGIPTYESIINNPYMQDKILGQSSFMDSVNNKFVELDDTISNYNRLVEEATQFNSQNKNKDRYIARVIKTESGKLKCDVAINNSENNNIYTQQKRQVELNKRIAKILEPIGVTIDMLTEAEQRIGIDGVMGLNAADNVANDSISIIRVANNKRGAEVLSEEFAHLLTRALNNNPFVQRSLSYLKNNPLAIKEILGDEYETYSKSYNNDLDLLAEEALGHILQNSLINENVKLNNETSIFKKLFNAIKQLFKSIRENEIIESIEEVNNLMDKIANSVLKEELKLTDIAKDLKKYQQQLYAVSANLNSETAKKELREVLEDIIKNEIKQIHVGANRIGKNSNLKATNRQNVSYLQSVLENPNVTEKDITDTIENYLHNCIRQVQLFLSNNISNRKEDLRVLRDLQMICQAYGLTIESINNFFQRNNTRKSSKLNKALNDLTIAIRDGQNKYRQASKEVFMQHCKDILGVDYITIIKDGKLTEVPIVDYLDCITDISFLDMLLDSLSFSSEPLLQVIDETVKKQNDAAKDRYLDDAREITALWERAKKLGVRDYAYVYEKDSSGNNTGNYIEEIWYGEFERVKQEFLEQLDKKYENVPKTDPAYANKREELLNFFKENYNYKLNKDGKYTFINLKESKWRNPAWQNLSNNQKIVLKEYRAYKEKLEDNQAIPLSVKDPHKAIQMRKNINDRVWDSNLSPIKLLKSIKKEIANSFLKRTDDNTEFGINFANQVLDFNNREFHRVPIFYVTPLEDANELSNDIFRSLHAYAYSIEHFKAIDEIVDIIEISRDVITNQGISNTGTLTKNIYKLRDKVYTDRATKAQSNVINKLNHYINSQIYSIFAQSTASFKIGDNEISAVKAVNNLISISSTAYLGFNWLANLANLATGRAMTRIEALAGQYFNYGELLRADTIYGDLIIDYLAESNKVYNQSDLSLLDDAIDFKGELIRRSDESQSTNWFRRLMDVPLRFLGQTAGDHWLYNRVAIAMMMHTKIVVNGKTMSIWDSRKVVRDKNGFKKMVFPDNAIFKASGNKFNIREFGRYILKINQGLFGIYNQEDINAAHRMMLGRIAQHLRKWIKPQFNKRFQKRYYDYVLGSVEEGYYRTFLNFIVSVFKSGLQIQANWDKLSKSEKYNLKRSFWELAQFAMFYLAKSFLQGGGGNTYRQRAWALKLADYMVTRETHELGTLALTPKMITEFGKTMKDPLPAITTSWKVLSLIPMLMEPANYTTRVQTGKYKGYTRIEKEILDIPIAPFSYIKQGRRIFDMDANIYYYAKPY